MKNVQMSRTKSSNLLLKVFSQTSKIYFLKMKKEKNEKFIMNDKNN